MQKRAETSSSTLSATISTTPRPAWGPDLQAFKSLEWVGRRDWGTRQRDKALKGMKYFNTVLADHPFVAGENSRWPISPSLRACCSPMPLVVAVPAELFRTERLARKSRRIAERQEPKRSDVRIGRSPQARLLM